MPDEGIKFYGHLVLIYTLVKSFIFSLKNPILSKMRFQPYGSKEKIELKLWTFQNCENASKYI